MEDILSQSSSHEQSLLNQTLCPITHSIQQRPQQRLLQSNSLNKLSLMQEQIQISHSARKMLETVLRNANINAVPHTISLPPQTIQDYSQLTLHILQNKTLYDQNIAHVVRSQVDLLKYDTALEQLVINQFGFQMHSRIFHNQSHQHDQTSDLTILPKNKSDTISNIDTSIGIVTLGQFMLEFGKRFDIFKELDLTYKNILEIAKITNIKFTPKDEKMSYLKINHSQGEKQTLISPVCSQQQLDEAKQYEAAQITKIFEDSQLQYLKTKGELFDNNKQYVQWNRRHSNADQFQDNMNLGTLNKNDESDDLVAADEDLTSINQQISKSILNSNSYGSNKNLQSKQKRYPEYSGLQTLLNQQHKQLLQQKQQKPISHQSQIHNKSPKLNQQCVNQHSKIDRQQVAIDYKQQQQLQEDTNKLIQELSYSLNNNSSFKPLLQHQSNEKSLISANNSYFNTPIKPPNNILYPNHSQFKPKNTNKTLFGQQQHNTHSTMPSQFYQESPKFLPTPSNNKDVNMVPRVLSFSANKILPNMQSPSPIKTQIQYIGQKRQNPLTSQQLSKQLYQEQQSNQGNLQNLEGFSTPMAKRQKISNDPLSTLTKGSHYPKNEDSLENQNYTDSEEEKDDANGNGDINDAASSASRKKRGLKILSVKVQELVSEKEQTTYKEVANELIKQLRDKKKNRTTGDTGGADMVDDFDDNNSGADDEDMSDDISPTKKTDKESSSSQQKWEKNVRRRVYDALNVLYAAGVLKKEGKHVSCDKQVLHLTNRAKDNGSIHNTQQQSTQKSNMSQKSQQQVSVQDQKMLQHIENLKLQLSLQMQKVEVKRDNLHEQFKHFLSYKHLIERNRDLKCKGYYDPHKSIQLPFILVSTKDCPDNEVEISFGEQNKSLNIAMKKPMKCIGDADTLIKLGLYKVGESFIYENIQDGENILRCLNMRQREEILA